MNYMQVLSDENCKLKRRKNIMKNLKNILLFQLIILILITISGTVLAQEAEYVWRTEYPHPEPHAEYSMMVFLKDRLEELSGGRIKLEIYYTFTRSPRESWDFITHGNLDIARYDQTPLLAIDENWKISSLPFFWENGEQLEELLNSYEFKEIVEPKFSEAGVKYIGSWAFPRHLYTRDPVKSLDDLKGKKIRTMEDEIIMRSWSALGAIPTPMPFGELFTSLQTGVVDGAEGSATAYTSNRFFEVAPYFSKIDYMLVSVSLIMNKNSYDKLPDDLKLVVDEVMSETIEYVQGLYRDWEDRALEEAKAEGAIIVYVEDLPRWRELISEAGILESVFGDISHRTFQLIEKYKP